MQSGTSTGDASLAWNGMLPACQMRDQLFKCVILGWWRRSPKRRGFGSALSVQDSCKLAYVQCRRIPGRAQLKQDLSKRYISVRWSTPHIIPIALRLLPPQFPLTTSSSCALFFAFPFLLISISPMAYRLSRSSSSIPASEMPDWKPGGLTE